MGNEDLTVLTELVEEREVLRERISLLEMNVESLREMQNWRDLRIAALEAGLWNLLRDAETGLVLPGDTTILAGRALLNAHDPRPPQQGTLPGAGDPDAPALERE